MPRMNKGGKFIFGQSLISEQGLVRLPPQTADEYHITSEGKVYLFTGSKSTGGFCVTRRGLLLPSELGHILTETPALAYYELPEGSFLHYKGRAYCWTNISEGGEIRLTEEMLTYLELKHGMCLLCIKSSNIAFTMGAKGPLLKKAADFNGEIPLF